MIKVHDKFFKPFISKDAIHDRILALGKQINEDYKGLNPLFLGILNGSFIFASDLFRAIEIAAEISFIRLISYEGTVSTGNVVTAIGLDGNLSGRHIVIIEDIVDTGKTLNSFMPDLWQRQPASVKIASFLSKPDALQYDIKADYVGFEIPNNFVVGYGLDYNGHGRNYPDLYTLA